jgi:hypothetical protein
MTAVEHKLWVCDVCGPLIPGLANATAKPARCVGCGRKARAYVRADTCRGAVDALREISESDPVDNALDPDRNRRIARSFFTTTRERS